MTDLELDSIHHLEQRLDRFTKVIDEKLQALRDELIALIAGNDLRYQQRYDAQGKALDAAFGAAKGAVDAALAGADKAAVKTELSADKRFADLGDLIREQFKGMATKLDGLENRLATVENRLNTGAGEAIGVRRSHDDSKAYWAIGISLVVAFLSLISRFLSWKP